LPRLASVARRTIVVAASIAFLASCTTQGPGSDIQADMPGYNASVAMTDANGALAPAASVDGGATASQVNGDPAQAASEVASSGEAAQTAMVAEPATASASSTDDAVAVQTALAPSPPTPSPSGVLASESPALPQTETAAAIPAPRPATPIQTTAAAANPAPVDPATAGDGSVVTAAEPPPAKPKKKGFLASFFGSNQPPKEKSAGLQLASVTPKPQKQQKAVRVTLPVDEAGSGSVSAATSSDGGLPGVRQSALFEIKRRSGVDDTADVDIYEENDGPVRIASAGSAIGAGLNGLLRQTESVDVACLKPSLVRTLKAIERRYGKKMVVTSGYRNPSHNRRARGAKNSLHMYCAAADVQIPGVGKWELAAFARSMAGRGGVGTYCHTNSVHIDVGPERDWNWRCRGRRK